MENMTDEQLLNAGLLHFRNDRLLAGAPFFRTIRNQSLIHDSPQNTEFFRRALLAEKLRADLSQPIKEGGWTKQGESHGDRDFITYYKTEEGGKLKCRIESVIESSLYVPFLATLNETDLYDTFFPHWHFPFKLGIHRSNRLQQCGRAEQLVQLTVDLPFPLKKREIILHGVCDEDCDNNTAAGGTVGAKLVTADESFDNSSGVVPPPEAGIVRMGFEADLMFCICPPDHAALTKSKSSKAKYRAGEKLILVTAVLYIDPRIALVPQAFMNFCTRTAIGTVWKQFLRIAEEVREGKRGDHAELIAKKREEVYDWIDERAVFMLASGTSDTSIAATTRTRIKTDTEATNRKLLVESGDSMPDLAEDSG